MSTLKKIFLKTLREADDVSYDPTVDEVPLQNRLEQDDIPVDALDVEPGPENVGYKAEVKAAQGWIIKIDEFVKYLNSVTEGSINHQVNVLDRDNSVFKGIASRISDKVARVSSDLAELKEIIAGFVISSDRKAKNIRMTDSVNVGELTLAEKAIYRLSQYGFELTESAKKSKNYKMVVESADETIRAEINEEGLVNGEDIDSYLDRLAKEYSIEKIISEDIDNNVETVDESIVSEEVIMDEKIMKQIKEIDNKLATNWDNELYNKRKELLSKMEKNYIDTALSLVGEDE